MQTQGSMMHDADPTTVPEGAPQAQADRGGYREPPNLAEGGAGAKQSLAQNCSIMDALLFTVPRWVASPGVGARETVNTPWAIQGA